MTSVTSTELTGRVTAWVTHVDRLLDAVAANALRQPDRPAVVVSVGGYASMPAVFAANRLGIPVVVVSYDRTPGRASRPVSCAPRSRARSRSSKAGRSPS